MRERKRKRKDSFLYALIYLSAALAVGLLAVILLYVFTKGIGSISIGFLTQVKSTLRGTNGIAGNILNTIYIIFLTLLFASPLGIGSAIYLNEYAKPGRFVRLVEFTTQTLAGIPSILFGLFGMLFFGGVLDLGYSILTGCLTLTLMILPLIIGNTREALRAVPESYRQGAAGMGATKWYMIRTILLPSAMPGIITGLILSVGRIVGESAALLFTAGSGYLLPNSVKGYFSKIFESGGTLTIELYLNMAKANYEVAFGIALVLLAIVFFINLLTRVVIGKWSKYDKN
ncbi:MAG: phosphate ABC transporter permease PstA [Lachnospiraceae bacterium]|nr:phosphate ABC transporter permease PstA [Lachnospiraceae bacterium]MDY3223101.1 phosphate ABC transporter permease PstA [Lachnospiraceae bacterium]